MSDTPPNDDFQAFEEQGPADVSSFPTLEELAILLPQYEFHQIIGIGGMGAVYLARQTQLDRWVALKVLPVSAAGNPEDADRFNTEARAMARLSHPNIVAVFDFGQTEAGHLYLAMEYVEGADLHMRTRAGEVTPDRARAVVAQLCEALHYAHEHGVIHRDIKPANILITPDWQVKVVDFGLARDLTAQVNLDEAEYGTPDYTAPERLIIGEKVDHRADIYSLGVVIHEILTGKTPLAAGASAGVGLPEGFAGVLSKCLMHDPARRYQTAGEVRAALLAAAAAAKKKAAVAPVNPPTAGPRALPPRPLSQNQDISKNTNSALLINLGYGVLCLVLLGGLGWLVWRDHFKDQAKDAPVEVAGDTTPVMEPPPPSPVVPALAESAPMLPPEPTTPMSVPTVSDQMSSNDSMSEPVVAGSSTMNKAIPTVIALAATTVSALSVDYKSQIMPIFRAKCYECHSEAKGKEKGDVALDTDAKLMAAIGPGLHIIPGEPEKSTMLISCKLPSNDDDVMPPKGKNRLTPAELTLLETWIKEGANLTGGSAAPATAMTPTPAAPTSWTSNDGKVIEATFVSLVGEQITLKMANGQEFAFPLSRLSAESQAQAKAASGL
ncbi:MAG: protein kinase [Prosthecobacter sp.]|nr:protein kinase [Prosthecobacter sp.]